MKWTSPFVTCAAFALCSASAHAGQAQFNRVKVDKFGVENAALASGGVTSNPIRVDTPFGASALTILFRVVPGTTLRVVVYCEESASKDEGNWHWIPFCEGEGRAACEVQKLIFPVDNGLVNWSAVPKPRAPWVRCTFEDEADGTGTITAEAIKYAE